MNPTFPPRRAFVASDARRRGKVSTCLKHKNQDTPREKGNFGTTFAPEGKFQLVSREKENFYSFRSTILFYGGPSKYFESMGYDVAQ
jgi:hypothetical protein